MSIIKKPDFLLPVKSIEYTKWASIACDQFTSEPEYWSELETIVSDSPSTLKITLPEIFLQEDNSQRVDRINQEMNKYLEEDNLKKLNGYVLVERTLNNGTVRLGILSLIDLEEYDYSPQSNSNIKPTEKTVEERLPIRVDIRKDATLELPHIMLLMDDFKQKIVDQIYKRVKDFELIYDFELNMNGGHIKGYLLDDIATSIFENGINHIKNTEDVVFCVGDGNHSLAAAKICYENEKNKASKRAEKLRFALVEIVSLYDKSIVFEPIHRIIYNAKYNDFVKNLRPVKGDNKVKIWCNRRYYNTHFTTLEQGIDDIQKYIDEYAKNSDIEIDYIHGDDSLLEIAKRENAVAIFMPAIEKKNLFNYIKENGVLSRKAFSIGVATDKRYYLEVRDIT